MLKFLLHLTHLRFPHYFIVSKSWDKSCKYLIEWFTNKMAIFVIVGSWKVTSIFSNHASNLHKSKLNGASCMFSLKLHADENKKQGSFIISNLVLSCRHLTNVVCSWGRKGFREIPPFFIIVVRVDKMALFTCHGNRSPIIRIRGLWQKGLAKSECIKYVPRIINDKI